MMRYWSQTLTMRYLWQYLKMGYLEAVKNSETVDENREALQEPARAVRKILKRNCLQFRVHAS